MRRTLRRSVLAAGGTLIGAAAARKLVPGATAQPSPFLPPDALRPHPPSILPPLAFQDAAGGTQTLAGLAGHGVVLNLWATWCVPCVAEMPALNVLAIRLAPAGIKVLAVSLDHGGLDVVRAFFASHGIGALPILLDPHSAVLQALGMDGIPATLLIDRAGREVARLSGPMDWSTPAAAARVRALVGA